MLLGDKLVTGICAYTPQTGRSAVEKDCFWEQMISVTGSIPASVLFVVGGDLNGHVGTNVNQSINQYSFNYGMTECRPNTENEYTNTQI